MNSFKRKRVLIFGLGLNQGGLGSAKFFASWGAKVKVTDLRDEHILKSSLDKLNQFSDIEYVLGEHKYEDIDWADLIIKNPAVKPGNPYIEYALKKDKLVKLDMEIFLQFINPSQIIGVTGTKGKSTTASLIYEALKNSGKNVVLAGNIGKSVLDIITMMQNSKMPPQGWQSKKNDTLIVLELSSFQLESFEKHKVSPKWAVITNVTPDHLNYYKNLDEYIEAKRIIGKYQTNEDFLFIRKDDLVTTTPDFLKNFKGKIIYFSKNDLPKDFNPTLKGEHNLENIAAAYQVGKVFGINSNLLLKPLTFFKGVPFRMELIKEWHGIKIINDTAATSPQSAIRAIETFPNCILICGGMNKGMSYKEFAKVVNKNVKKVFFLEGDSTDEIKSQLSVINHPSPEKIAGTYNNLEKLLKDVKKIAKPGDTILFSPAATSFNLFQNEWDRGRKFNEAVEKIFR